MKKESFILKIISTKTIKRLEKKNLFLGNNSNDFVIKFLKRRLISIIVLFFILVFTKQGFIVAPIVVFLVYILAEYIVFDVKITIRKSKLDNEALFFFEALVLSLDSGVSIEKALELTTKNIDSELSNEFKKVLAEINLGKTLTEALNNFKKRIPSENINTVILNIIQSNKFGTDITTSIYDQVDYLREKKYLELKGNISKLPVKLSIISVLFYIPLMLLLILSPILLNLFLK